MPYPSIPDGIQLLFLIDQGLDACKYLISQGQWAKALAYSKVNHPPITQLHPTPLHLPDEPPLRLRGDPPEVHRALEQRAGLPQEPGIDAVGEHGQVEQVPCAVENVG